MSSRPDGSFSSAVSSPSSGVRDGNEPAARATGAESPARPRRRRTRPRRRDVLLDRAQGGPVGIEAPVDETPGGERRTGLLLREDAVRLGERLPRVEPVVGAVVARKCRVLLRPPAHMRGRRPPLRPPVGGAPRRIRAVRGDVVAVLVPRHVLGRDSVVRLARHDELASVVATERFCAAESRDLAGRGDANDERAELASVRDAGEELGPPLRDDLPGRVRRRGVDRDRLPGGGPERAADPAGRLGRCGPAGGAENGPACRHRGRQSGECRSGNSSSRRRPHRASRTRLRRRRCRGRCSRTCR